MSEIYGITVATPMNPEKFGGSGSSGSGEDGFSPIANVTQTDTGAVISITDKSGTTTATISDGKDGVDGNGIARCTVTTSTASGGENTVKFVFDDGTEETFKVKNGVNGTSIQGRPGADGFSPVAKVIPLSNGSAVISIEDANGITTATITNGKNGTNGTSATHSWNGTVLTVSSASGTSSADLKGAKGDKGDKGDSIKGDKGDTGAKGDKGDPGNSGVYILSDGETIEDAPADANVIIDPNGSADSSGSGDYEVGTGGSASQPSSGAVVGGGRKIKTTELTLAEDTYEVKFDLQNYTDCELFFEMETGVVTKAKFTFEFPAINNSKYRNYGLQTAVSFQYKLVYHIRIFNDGSGDHNRHVFARNKTGLANVIGAYWSEKEDGFYVRADASTDVLPAGTKIKLTEIYWEG